MNNNSSVLLVMPATNAGTPEQSNGSRILFVFSSPKQMGAWMAAQQEETYWHVRLLDRAGAASILEDFCRQGHSEIQNHLSDNCDRKTGIEELVTLFRGG